MKIPEQVLKRINPLISALLKSPLHGLISKDFMLVTVTGRRSGRSYTRPVTYVREGDTVRCFTSLDTAWWKNLLGGAEVSLRVRGQELRGHAEAIHGEEKRVADALAAFLVRQPGNAAYHDIALDDEGQPDAADVEREVSRAVLVEVTLH